MCARIFTHRWVGACCIPEFYSASNFARENLRSSEIVIGLPGGRPVGRQCWLVISRSLLYVCVVLFLRHPNTHSPHRVRLCVVLLVFIRFTVWFGRIHGATGAVIVQFGASNSPGPFHHFDKSAGVLGGGEEESVAVLSGTQRGVGPRFGTPAASTCSNHNSTWTPPIIFILSYKQVSDQCLTSRTRSTLIHCVCICECVCVWLDFFHPSSPPHGVVRLYRYMLVGCCCCRYYAGFIARSRFVNRGTWGGEPNISFNYLHLCAVCTSMFIWLSVGVSEEGYMFAQVCELKSN